MCIEHRSSAHPVGKPYSQSSNQISTCYCNIHAFLPAIVLISISSIYMAVIYALYAMHLIVKQIVSENIEINRIGRNVFRRHQQLHAKQVNCTSSHS